MTTATVDATTDTVATRAPRLWVVLVVFLLVSAVASPLLLALQTTTGWSADAIVLTQLATAVGALVVWAVWRGRVPRPAVTERGWRRPLLVSVVAAVVVGMLLLGLDAMGGRDWPVLHVGSVGVPLGLVLLLQLVGAAGEEVGWRGVVQPALETRIRLVPAGVVTGLLFGLGHVHVVAAGAAVFGLFVVASVGLSLLLAHATAGRSVAQRVVIASVLHWLVNLVILLGFSGGSESVGWMAALAAATGAVGLVCVVLGKVGRNPFTGGR